MPLELKNVQLIGNELAMQWNDGVESYLPPETFQRPEVSYSPSSFELVGWQMIGGYALQPRWADGHSTGLYSFQYLRRLTAEPAS